MKTSRWMGALLEWAVPRGHSIRGDLDREYREREPGVGRELWYGWEVAKLVVRYSIREGRMGGRIRRNLGYALRRIRRDPGFALVSVGTMALGIGGSVAIFSVLDAVLLEPLPVDEPDRLVAVFESQTEWELERNVANPGNVRSWRDDVGAFEGLGAVASTRPAVLTAPGEPREVMLGVTTTEYFRVLGLEPLLGPGYGEEVEGNQVMLSYRGWQELLGGDPEAVGRTLTAEGQTATVVGVLPAGYVPFADDADLFLAMPLDAMGDQTSTGRFLSVVARLAPDVSLEAARTELGGVVAGLQEAYPDFNAGWAATMVPLQDVVIGDVRAPLWILMGAASLLLLVACANVANVGLARATDRQREMAVRSSLGASSGTLTGQLLVESGTLALLGGALGIGAAQVATKVMATRLPGAFTLPRVEQAGVDGGVLLVALGITAACGLLVGLVPAIQVRRHAHSAVLNAESRGPGRGTLRFRDLLVVGEVAVSVVLVIGASLLTRSFGALVSTDSGLRPEGVVTARVSVAGPEYDGTEPDIRFFTTLADRFSEIPGVDIAGGVTYLPMGDGGAATIYRPGDRPAPPPGEWPAADVRNVVGDYFEAIGIRTLRGRPIDGRDDEDALRAVVVNRTLAESQWPGEEALGKSLILNWGDLLEFTVVGVVEDVRTSGLGEDVTPTLYLPYRQAPFFPFMSYAVRTRGDTEAVVTAMRDAVGALDAGIPLSRVRIMEDVVTASVARPRMTTALMGVFAVVAGVLAAVGLYGVLSYAVARRMREFGVRMALGAEVGDVLGLVTRRGLGLAGTGLLLGLGVALAGADVLGSLLFGVGARDPVSFVGAAALLVAVAAAASLIPAWRATRVAPIDALRSD